MSRMRVEPPKIRPRAVLAGALLVGLLLGLLSAATMARRVPAYATTSATTGTVVPIIFPLEQKVAWTDTFGAPRSGGRTHEGNDIMCPKMTPLLAVVGGTLDWMNTDLEASSYNGQPYFNILLRGDDGNDYFYIHMNNDTPGTDDGKGGLKYAYAAGLKDGIRVEQGQLLGWAGDSGNAEDSGSHLHFELHLGGYDNPVNPYASLNAAPTWAEWQGQGSTTTTVPGATTTTLKPGTTTTVPGPTTTTVPAATTTTTEPSQVPFGDVTAADWYYPELLDLYGRGVVKGSVEGTFAPYSEVTRAQFAALLVRALAPEALHQEPSGAAVFSDVPQGHWAYTEVAVAAALGLVRGTGDGSTFSPQDPISRAQMATMICRALDEEPDGIKSGEQRQRLFTDVPGDYWAAGAISSAAELGVMTGADGCFRPDETSKRAHAIAVLSRALALLAAGASS